MYIIVQCSVEPSSDFFGTANTTKLPNLLTFGNVWMGAKSRVRGVWVALKAEKWASPPLLRKNAARESLAASVMTQLTHL